MQRHKFFAPIRPGAEIGIEGNARKLTLKVQRIFFTIDRIVQDAVDIVKNGVLGDLCFYAFVVRAKLFQGPVGDVVNPFALWCVPLKWDNLDRIKGEECIVWNV
jgi:hypothetical protein